MTGWKKKVDRDECKWYFYIANDLYIEIRTIPDVCYSARFSKTGGEICRTKLKWTKQVALNYLAPTIKQKIKQREKDLKSLKTAEKYLRG